MDIATWLCELGMQQYLQAFRDNAIDAAVLPELSADDLKDLGVRLVDHRRKLLAAIAALRRDDRMMPEGPADKTAAVTAPERRLLTVMFCDLVGSTELGARLDPEDLREVIGAYHRAVAEVVAGFDGFVAKYMGDGVLVYFGYPRAHEDDAERAVRSGLGLIHAIGRLDVKSVKLQARVGIATGLVVVGDLIGEGSAQEQSVVGETPNLAAWLQALAEPNAVVIVASTCRLIYRDLGPIEVKGITRAVPAWQLVEKSRLPALYPWREYVEAGGLMAYASDDRGLWRRITNDVHEILNGAKPGDIPIYQATKFAFVINLKAANALGLTFPPALLAAANEVIE